MPQILCVACFIAQFQLEYSNALLVILISDYGLLLEKTITDSSQFSPVQVGRLLVSFLNWLGLLRLCPTEDLSFLFPS